MALSPASMPDNLHVAFHNLRFEFDLYKLRGTMASHMLNLKLKQDAHKPNVILPSLFTNNGRILATACVNGIVELWDTVRGIVVHQLNHKGEVDLSAKCYIWCADWQCSGV